MFVLTNDNINNNGANALTMSFRTGIRDQCISDR